MLIYAMHKLADVRNFCPVLRGLSDEEIAKLVPIVSREPYQEDTVGKAKCVIPVEQIIGAGILDGCRGITQLSSTGCILRNSEAVKLDITDCK